MPANAPIDYTGRGRDCRTKIPNLTCKGGELRYTYGEIPMDDFCLRHCVVWHAVPHGQNRGQYFLRYEMDFADSSYRTCIPKFNQYGQSDLEDYGLRSQARELGLNPDSPE